MTQSETETTTDEKCINCGNDIDGDGVFTGDSVKPGADESLSGGESVPLSELIEFNDGPYCSLDCSITAGGENQ